jgi:N utilization substance protein B
MMDQGGQSVTQAFKQTDDLRELPEELAAYARKIVRGSHRRLTTLDALFSPHLSGWRLDRLAPVDRTIIRLALYEITEGLVPVAVAVDEAVELAKTYGSEDSPRFVNGILGSTVRALVLSDATQPAVAAPDSEEDTSAHKVHRKKR